MSEHSRQKEGGREQQKFEADRILSYFKMEWPVLLAVTISGLIYNLGLLAGPWFEGKMAGCLVDILGRQSRILGYGKARDQLCGCDRNRPELQIYQTFLCETFCQQRQPADEGHPV